MFGEELYPDLASKSAALIRAIIADHSFTDGNKRTAMLTGLTFLNLNGLFLSINKGEIEDYAVKVALNKLDVATISQCSIKK